MRALGAEVVLRRRQLRRRAGALRRASSQTAGFTFVHPFDDPLVIAGQGTIGDEILRHRPAICRRCSCPVGGGGLIAGIAGYIKALRPDVRDDRRRAATRPTRCIQSLAAGRARRARHVGIFADGVAVREVGADTFPIVQADGRRDRARHQRRDLRRDQGRLRRHAHDHGAGRRAGVAGLRQWVERDGVDAARRWRPS